MKLSQSTLPEYFTIADSTSSWYKEPTNTFNFVDRNSDTLIVTVGDSWTWGSDLSEYNHDDQYRIEHVYGNQIAKHLDADWLNLALSASGNFWQAEMVEELAKVIPVLEYQQIYVICTLTEVGRWFNTHYDQHIDYISYFKNTIQVKEDFTKFLKFLNEHAVSRVLEVLKSFKHVKLLVGTNMVDPIGLEQLHPTQRLAMPWYQVIGIVDTAVSYMITPAVQSLLQVPEFLSSQTDSLFKEWMLDIIPIAEHRQQLLEDNIHFRNVHPSADQHQQWANYILSNL